MTDLSEILYKAYRYTKDHKFLWFFGFFLTGWGTLNFIRNVDFNSAELINQLMNFRAAWQAHPTVSTLAAAAAGILLVGLTILGALARAAIIYSGLHLERKDPVSARIAIAKTRNSLWRVFWVGIITGIMMFAILTWLGVPFYFVFRAGAQSGAVILTLAALVIFVPIIIILSLVNIFSACYIVVYDFKIMPALKGSFDLLASFIEDTFWLFLILFIIYVSLFFLSATVLGLFGFLGYGLSLLFKGLPANALSGILLVFISLLSFLLVFVNAILNVFTNFAWTLFFLKIVKAKFLKDRETAAEPVA